jgi:hypothetical protein
MPPRCHVRVQENSERPVCFHDTARHNMHGQSQLAPPYMRSICRRTRTIFLKLIAIVWCFPLATTVLLNLTFERSERARHIVRAPSRSLYTARPSIYKRVQALEAGAVITTVIRSFSAPFAACCRWGRGELIGERRDGRCCAPRQWLSSSAYGGHGYAATPRSDRRIARRLISGSTIVEP